ncbi:8398_t:CDS:2, partial [Scutellospora calospora]
MITETGSENLREKYIIVLKENSEYLQKNIKMLNTNNALKNNKDDLIKQNKELKEQIETELDKLNKEVEKNKKTNYALKILLQEFQNKNKIDSVNLFQNVSAQQKLELAAETAPNSDSYDSSSNKEISIRLNKLKKEIAILSDINQEKNIEKSKKIFKIINKQLIQKEKKFNFLREENYDLQGQ